MLQGVSFVSFFLFFFLLFNNDGNLVDKKGKTSVFSPSIDYVLVFIDPHTRAPTDACTYTHTHTHTYMHARALTLSYLPRERERERERE